MTSVFNKKNGKRQHMAQGHMPTQLPC